MKTTSTLWALLFFALLFSSAPHVQAQTFRNPIRSPYLMDGQYFSIDIHTSLHNFDPEGTVDSVNLNVPIETYCYNQTANFGMTYLGPTLIFTKGETLDFSIFNALPPGVSTTVHWHGLNIPAQMDGGPHQVIRNRKEWRPRLPIIDDVQTIWYHTHLMDSTTEQVIRGLAGMIIVQDPENDPLYKQLPHEYDLNDIPLVIQEKDFIMDRSVSPPRATELLAGKKPGNGPYTLVNGVVNGVRRVPPQMVRLRILNGSPRKMFHIGLSTQLKNPAEFTTMWMFATGGGYIDYPRPMDSTLMAIGDRREFLVDFSSYSDGDTIYMSNLAVPKDANYGSTPGDALMAFVVDSEIQPSAPFQSIPATLVQYELAPGPVFQTREKKLMGHPDPPGKGQVWTIDGQPMDLKVINDTILVNTKERWIIENQTTQAHPFHIHKVQFQVVEYAGKLDAIETEATYTYPDLPAELIGYKDVQLIRGGATLTFDARFDSFPSPLEYSEGFMYHCHILSHEDTSMMHQFVVVDSVDFYANVVSTREANVVRAAQALFAYPNPASGTLSFKGDFKSAGTLRFYDLYGRLLREEEILALDGATVPVADLPRGLILVEFTSGRDRYLQKVMLH